MKIKIDILAKGKYCDNCKYLKYDDCIIFKRWLRGDCENHERCKECLEAEDK